MVELGRKRKGVVQPEKETEYEMQRNANILANEKRIQELNLRALSHEVSSPLKKKKKAACVVGSEDVIARNIRSSTRLTAARVGLQAGNANAEEPNSAAHDLQAGNANAEEPVGALHVQEKKKVRGPTKKANIFARQNKPKLKVEINEYGQPCGDSSTEFANFIGALVRTNGFPLAADDWRKVEARHKYKLWTDAQYEHSRSWKTILEKLQQQAPSQNRNSTPHGSNNELLVNSRIRPSHADEELNDDEDDVESYAGDEMQDEHFTDYEGMFMPRRVARSEEEQHAEGGRDVILYSVVRPYDVPVAKATVQTSNPSAVVGGTRLGVQYSEVVVNHVFAREAILPRPYGAVTTIGQAVGKCIAWPCDRMKDDKKSSRQLKP